MRTNNKKNKKNTSSKNTVSKKNQTLLTTALTSSLGLALTPSVGAADTIAINNLTSRYKSKRYPICWCKCLKHQYRCNI